MSDEKKLPKRRFKQFLNAPTWEQRKLGEVVKSYSGGTPTASNKEYYGGDIPFIRSAEINSDMTELYITQKGLDNSSAKMVEKGTILYAMYGATSGEVGISKINGAINQAILAMIPSGYNSKIIAQYLRKNKESIIGKYLQGGQGNLSANIILDLPIQLPRIEESNQIANFLESFDNLITLHQRKLNKLEKLKKAYLEELFPAVNQCKPKRRFKEFKNDWEQRKFTYLLDKKDGIRRGPFGSALKKSSFVKESQYTVYEQQNAIYDKFDTRYNITKEKFDELHKFQLVPGDFIMSGAGTIGRISRVPNGIKAGIFNQALIRFKIDETLVDSEYFLEWMRSEGMQKEFTKANPGSAMVNLVPMSEVKEWEVLLPTKNEQYKIGNLLSKISTLITLHQRKLQKLKKLKAAYLEELFV